MVVFFDEIAEIERRGREAIKVRNWIFVEKRRQGGVVLCVGVSLGGVWGTVR